MLDRVWAQMNTQEDHAMMTFACKASCMLEESFFSHITVHRWVAGVVCMEDHCQQRASPGCVWG